MDSQKLKQIEEIYHSALEIAPDKRESFLDESCGKDIELRREVESLLSFKQTSDGLLETPPEMIAAEMFSKQKSSDNIIGKEIRHYKIKELLGKGGMGEIYLAEDIKLNRQVALKILPAEFAEDKERMSRFVREAKSASALNHPNIITIHEINEVDNLHYIATEYIKGKTLNDYVSAEPLKLSSVMDISIQVASALDEAHTAGIVHRDIKPDNIMVRANGLVKILDFGIAKLTEKETPEIESENTPTIISLTMPGMIIGTANYMSPEQASGQKIDARTDIFSFGVVLYQMVSGEHPFEGTTAMEMISSILKDEPKPLNVLDIHPDLEEIIAKTLKKDLGERYSNTKELLTDLQGLKKKIDFEAELERTTSSDRKNEEITRKLKVVTDDESPANITNANANSIAVLPFTNMSSDAENEYFCDGLAEELLNALTKLDQLKVAARTSAFSFKGKNIAVSEIARALGVKKILEGSARKFGNRLRVSVQLVNASDGFHLWSDQYDREMEDVFEVQDDIALSVVDALKLTFFGDEKASVMKRYTSNPEAYQLYLKGRYHFARRTIDDFRKAIESFQQAIDLDPKYALAYVGIADIYNSWAKSLMFPPNDSIPQAKSAAKKALEIDPHLAEAHASIADSLAIFDWNWAESEQAFKRAIELNPNVSNVHFYYGISYLVPMGRFSEAIAELKRAIELEPLSLIANTILAEVYLFARQYDKALDQAKKAFDLNPNFGTARFWLGHALLANGMNEEAIELCENGLQNSPSNLVFLYIAGQSYARSDQRQKAEQIIEQLREESKTKYVQSYSVARIYTELGDKDKAFAELEKAFEQRDWWLTRLKTDPLMDSLRDDPRFKDLLKRINLPE